MKLSIVVATRNRIKLLNQLLESIESASIVDGIDAELLILDNDCTDDTSQVLNGWNSRLKFETVKNESNYRGSLQYGQLVSLARGDWIISPGDDDVFVPMSLSNLANLCRLNALLETTLIAGEALTMDGVGRKLPKVYKPPKFKDRNHGLARSLFENPFWMPATAVRKSSIEFSDYPESLTTTDWWLWINGLTRGGVFYTDEPLISYRIHEGQEQRTYLNQMWELDRLRVFLGDIQNGSLKTWVKTVQRGSVSKFIFYLKEEIKGRQLSITDLTILTQLILDLERFGKMDQEDAKNLLIQCGVDPRFVNTWFKQTSQDSDFNQAIEVAKSTYNNGIDTYVPQNLTGEKGLNFYLYKIREFEIRNTITPMERKLINAYRRIKNWKIIRRLFKR